MENKVGINSSAVTTTVDYKLSGVPATDKAASLTGTETLTNKTLTNPIVNTIQGNWDGWYGNNGSWTYASGTTMTVPAGGLLKYAVSDKVKLNQSIPLQNYYPFDSNSTDSKGSKNGTDVGTPTYTSGKFSNALTLNGSSNYVKVTDDSSLHLGNSGTAFSFGMWFKLGAVGSYQTLFQVANKVTNQNGCYLIISDTNLLGFLTAPNTGATTNTNISGSTVLTTGTWYYVVVSFQGNYGKIFLNGNLEASGYLGNPVYSSPNITIGAALDNSVASNWVNGQIDDLFIINGFAVDQYWVAAKYAQATAQGTSNITPTQYFYVTTVADTLLTLTGGADYVLYNTTITSPYYSKSSSPVGFPQWFNYAAVLASASSPTGIHYNLCRFMITGRKVTVEFDIYATATGAQAVYTLTAPIATSNYLTFSGQARAGVAAVSGHCAYNGTSTSDWKIEQYDKSNWAASGTVYATGKCEYEI